MSSHDRDPNPVPDDGGDASLPRAVFDRAWKLLDAVLDGRASAAEREELEQLVVQHPPVARLCLRAVHMWYSLQLHMQPDRVTEELLRETADWSEAGLDETMILPSLRDEIVVDRSGPYDLQAEAPSPVYFERRRRRSRWPAVLAVAAGVALTFGGGLSLWLTLRPPTAPVAAENPQPKPARSTPATKPAPPNATLTALAGAVIDGADASPGSPLASGRTFRLTRGAVELAFASRATVVVTAPAEFRVVDRNTLALESGSIAASVPPPAVGFSVQAPGLTVVDRGTNFGVRTVDGGAGVETAVFTGIIDATAIDAGKRPLGTSVRLTAGQAVRRDALSNQSRPVPASFAPEKYNREVDRVRIPLAAHSTGEGVAPGEADAHWQVVSVPDDPRWAPRPALVVAKQVKIYEQQAPGLRWVSLSADAGDVANGVYVFRTTIDLTGFDPATVQLSAHAVADNEITELRVNGEHVSVQKAVPGRVSSYLLDLSNLKWKAGPNEVDVVVLNTADRGATSSPTGLNLTWTGTACPVVQR